MKQNIKFQMSTALHVYISVFFFTITVLLKVASSEDVSIQNFMVPR
jgi:hypothetical protein